jgi:DNA-binding SARP family transcriptional activator
VATIGGPLNRSRPEPRRHRALRLRLLGAFALERNGRVLDVPRSAQRILAFLALRPYALQRRFVAGSLWLDAPEGRAEANLRSAIWRLRSIRAGPIVLTGQGTLRLDSHVSVDIHLAREQAHRWLTKKPTPGDLTDHSSLQSELLPDWYEEWVIDERDQFRQLRLHALEAMAETLSRMGRHADALLAALDAATEDPLRESAQRTLIKVHLAEGNTSEAIRQLRRCEQLFERELGLRPSRTLTDMVRDAVLMST